MELSGEHFNQLHTALLNAFNRAELTQFVRTELGVDLDHVAGSGTLSEVVTELISWAERNELVADLVAKAAHAVPLNAALQRAAADYPTWRPQPPLPVLAGQENRPARGGIVLGFGVFVAAGALVVLFSLWLRQVQSPPGAPAPASESAVPAVTSAILPPTASAGAPAAGAAPTVVAQANGPSTPTSTPTAIPTAAPTATPLPYATARPGEYLVIVSEFYPPLAQYPEFDVLDTLVSTLQDAFAAHNASRWRIAEHPDPIMDAGGARLVGLAAQARAVLWGRVSAGRLSIRITSTLPQSELIATRLDSGPSLPADAFFNEYAPARLQTYIAPFIVGQYAMHVGDYAGAQQLFAQAIAATTADPPDGIEYAHLLEGNADYRLADYQSAQDHYTSALQANPGLLDAYYNRALTHGWLGDIEAADQDLQALLSRDPGYSYAYVNRGLILLMQAYAEEETAAQTGLWEAAEEAFTQALATLPPAEAAYAFDIYSNLAVVHYRLGSLAQAKADFERAVGPNLDCAPVFTSELAQLMPDRAGDMCAQAAYSYSGLYMPIEAGSSRMVAQLTELVIEHASLPLLKSSGLARLAEVYQFDGKWAEACSLAQQASAGLPDAEHIRELVQKVCTPSATPLAVQ